jgi:hypothetical protein
MLRNVDRRAWALLGVLALAAPAAGCANLYHDRSETISFGSGDAVASNKVSQMIDPWPRHAADKDLAHDGSRMARAVERYRTNRTTPLASSSTSSTQFVPVMAPAAAGGGGSSTSNQ